MPRGILMIVIDCLRADHVGCYGYGRATTPFIDSLAADGIRFEQAHSLSSWTKPSVASLLTGRHPCEHGAFEGIKRSKGRLTTTDKVPDDYPTVAEALTQAGWRCGAFTNNDQLGEFTGLSRGFDAYDSSVGKADRLIEQFLAWLDRDPGQPFFGYVHFMEAHWPYKPRRRHVSQFGGDRDRSHFRDFSARDYGRLRRAISREGLQLAPELLEDMVRMYDGAVRRLDTKVRLLLQELQQRGMRDDTLVVVTADHGEEFLEHGHLGHGHSLYDEVTHVPLVMKVPEGPCGVVRAEPVSQVSLAATLLARLGLEHPGSGRDLLEPSAATAAVHSELRIRGRYHQTIHSGDWKLHRHFKFDTPQACEAYTRFDDVASAAPKVTHELYDIASDPRESHELSEDARGAAVRSRLAAELDSWWEDLRAQRLAGVGCEVEIDDSVVERLRDLGYLD